MEVTAVDTDVKGVKIIFVQLHTIGSVEGLGKPRFLRLAIPPPWPIVMQALISLIVGVVFKKVSRSKVETSSFSSHLHGIRSFT